MYDKELISALVDDEASVSELSTLPALLGDVDARGAWQRYQAIGDLMRDGERGAAPVDLVRRVALQLAREESLDSRAKVVPLPARPAAPARWQRALPLAAAAAVGAIAVGLWQTGEQGLVSQSAVAEQTGAAGEGVNVAGLSAEVAQVSTLSADEYRRRMDTYLLNFNEQRSRMGVPQPHAYVRVVGFEAPGAGR
jgi:negative regulator of sigma E activity